MERERRISLFLTGASVYPALEIICRGKTDFSMALAGGACVCLIDRVCNKRLCTCPLVFKCFAGSAIITGVEFFTGVIVNLVLKLNVWDYSALPFNVWGQVCLPFSILWAFLTLPAMQLGVFYGKLQRRLEG